MLSSGVFSGSQLFGVFHCESHLQEHSFSLKQRVHFDILISESSHKRSAACWGIYLFIIKGFRLRL